MEIEVCKFTVPDFRGLVANFSRFFGRIKQSQVDSLSFTLNPCSPFLMYFTPMDADITTATIGSKPSIAHISRASRYPKIRTAIVQRISVAVIDFFLALISKNLSRHKNASPLRIMPSRVKTFCELTP